MASSFSSSKTPCTTCSNKAAGIYRCEGCSNVFCRKHLNDHRDLLSHQLDEIVFEHDILHQTIVENQKKQNNQHPILKEIDQWEINSIVKIQQMAEEARQQVKNSTNSQTGILKKMIDCFCSK
jgi:DNA polymerase III gamma/tau subunit